MDFTPEEAESENYDNCFALSGANSREILNVIYYIDYYDKVDKISIHVANGNLQNILRQMISNNGLAKVPKISINKNTFCILQATK